MSVCSSSFKLHNLSTFSRSQHNHDVVVTTIFRYLSLRHSTTTANHAFFKLQCASSSDSKPNAIKISANLAEESIVSKPRIDGGGGGEGDDGSCSGDGGGGGNDGEGSDGDEKEFGPIRKFEEVMKEAEGRGVNQPSDMMEAAKTTGIRKMFLIRYLDLQIVIDSCCATFAEVQKRGKDFWSEFELYLADLLVGVVVDIALVGMLAPYARIGQPPVSSCLFECIQHACGSLPSSVFKAERPGCRFSVKPWIATYLYKEVLYGSVGFGCGLIGQGITNLIMTAKRCIKKSEEYIPMPPLVKSAARWGVFS